MTRQGSGSLVFIASVSGMSSAPNHVAYGAAKAGVMSLARTAAAEFGPYGVRANAISPGSIDTPPKGAPQNDRVVLRLRGRDFKRVRR